MAECANHGGIKPLVALLGSERSAQAHAAQVLSDMTKRSKDNQAAVAQEGGIAQLVALLTTGFNEDAKAEAAGALRALLQVKRHRRPCTGQVPYTLG